MTSGTPRARSTHSTSQAATPSALPVPSRSPLWRSEISEGEQVSEFPLQVTIKPPAQLNSAPWLNFQAQDQDDLEAQLRAAFPTVEADTLSELVAKSFLEYGAVLTAAIGLAAPAAPQEPSIQSSGPAPQ